MTTKKAGSGTGRKASGAAASGAPGDRLAALKASIRKQFGDEAVTDGDAIPAADVSVISTGSVNLDHAIGVGGIPRGRSVEIYGAEASGKSTIAINAMAQAQRMGLLAAYIDTEHALVPEWAETNGLDMKELFITQPATAEEALGICKKLVASKEVGIIVVDSVAAMATEAELDKEIGDSNVALQARLMSQALRQLCAEVHTSNTALVFINQVRDSINTWGNAPREVTSGGNALKFYANVRIRISRIETLKQGGQPIGTRVRATVGKNKVAPPFRTAEFEILFDRGIDRTGEYLDHALEQGHITKRGNWHYREDAAIGNGREATRRTLEQDPELMAEVIAEVNAGLAAKRRVKPPRPAAAAAVAAPPAAAAEAEAETETAVSDAAETEATKTTAAEPETAAAADAADVADPAETATDETSDPTPSADDAAAAPSA